MSPNIHRLDNDSLGLIFDSLVHIDPPSRDTRNNHRPVQRYELGWITSTHVCRRWRMLALSKPSLWARCVSDLPHVFTAMLDRAGDAPLHVKMDFRGQTKRTVTFMPTLRKCIYNVESLRVSLAANSSKAEQDELRDTLSGRMLLRLIDLDIYVSGKLLTSRLPFPNPTQPILVDAPSLRTVTFGGVQGHLRTNCFSLRSLTIDNK